MANPPVSVMRCELSASFNAGASLSGAPDTAMDSASTRALLATYPASSCTTRVESARSSEVLGENQRSIDRFIN